MANLKDAPVEKDEAMRTLFEDFQAMCKANGLVEFKDIETAYIAGRADQSKLFVERHDHREEVIKKVVEALKRTFLRLHPDDGRPCWCDWTSMVNPKGHYTTCLAARFAISAYESMEREK